MKRVASVIGIADENIAEYERLHKEVWPSVLARISESNIRNYSIYRFENLLFSYFEYVGSDYSSDMAAIAADQNTQEWWKLTDPLQYGLPGRAEGEWWQQIQEVFHTD